MKKTQQLLDVTFWKFVLSRNCKYTGWHNCDVCCLRDMHYILAIGFHQHQIM